MSSGHLKKFLVHTKNKHMDEGALRNVLFEIKDVIKPINALIKQQNAAMDETAKWSQTQKMVVCTFLGEMALLERELTAKETAFIEGYQEYVQEWSEILSERKELKALQDALRKSVKKVEAAKHKVETAEKTAEKDKEKMRERTGSKSGSRPEVTKPTSPKHDEAAPAPTGSTPATPVAPTTPSDAPVPADGAAAASPSPAPAAAAADGATLSPPPLEKGSSSPKLLRGKGSHVDLAHSALMAAEAERDDIVNKVAAKVLETQKELHVGLRNGFYKLCVARMRMFRDSAFLMEKALSMVQMFPAVIDFEDDDGENFKVAPFSEPPGPFVTQQWHHGDSLAKALTIEREAARAAIEAERHSHEHKLNVMQKKHAEEIKELQDELKKKDHDFQERLTQLQGGADTVIKSLDAKIAALEKTNKELHKEVAEMQQSVLQIALNEAKIGINEAKSAVTDDCVDFLIARVDAALGAASNLEQGATMNKGDFVIATSSLARNVTGAIMSSMAVAQTLEASKAEKIGPLANKVAASAVTIVQDQVNRLETGTAPNLEHIKIFHADAAELRDFVKLHSGGTGLPADVDATVHSAQKAIQDALDMLNKMKADSAARDSGRQLEVNQALIDIAIQLMHHMKDTIDAALKMQTELKVEHEHGMSGAEYKLRHRKWVQGLDFAVKAVVEGNPLWLECMKQVLTKNSKYDELQVATRTLAAFSAQLLANTRTKTTLSGTHSQDNVAKSTETLILTSHSMLTAIREVNNLALASVLYEDYNTLSENQVKKLVMNTKVEILGLEQSLTSAQEKLRRLQKINYHESKKAAAADS